jgi:hypothetical protein
MSSRHAVACRWSIGHFYVRPHHHIVHFPDPSQKSKFFRTLRLVHDDTSSYAHSAAPYFAINQHADDLVMIAKLNADATFWNSVLASLQSTAVISLARLHDKSKNKSHLLQFIRLLQKQSRECVEAANQLEQAISQQQPFIDRILTLRNELFAHTSFEAPLVIAFGFEGLALSGFREYWFTLMPALVECQSAMFGDDTVLPHFDVALFEEIEQKTHAAMQKIGPNEV